MYHLRRRLALIFASIAVASFLLAQEPSTRKVAFLVGVTKYEKDGLSDLQFPEKDIDALETELKKAGFEVHTLRGSESGEKRATKANLDRLLGASSDGKKLGDWLKIMAGLKKTDTALIAFTGHGVQQGVQRGNERIEDAFFCPVDANKSDPDSMFSVGELLKNVGEHSGSSVNLIVMDACRNDPRKGARNIDGSTMRVLPNKISILFGSSRGELSWESAEFGHGLLTQALLEGLRGEASNKKGEITWGRLTDYAQERVPELAKKMEQVQRPNIIKNLNANPVLRTLAASDAGKPFSLDLGSGVTLQLLPIPAGSFTMGSTDSDAYDNEKPPHRVTISKPFYMGRTEVTVGQWKRFIAEEGYKTTAETNLNGGRGRVNGQWKVAKEFNWRNTGFAQDDDHPVTNVSWNDVQKFCAWLSKKTREKVRLPYECEWEFACRAGTTTKYCNGDSESSLEEVAWFDNNTNSAGTRAVATKKPNAFGLYDMHGNVKEFCQDGSRTYKDQAETDPRGLEDPLAPKMYPVYRGGCFASYTRDPRSSNRSNTIKNYPECVLGFRVVVVR